MAAAVTIMLATALAIVLGVAAVVVVWVRRNAQANGGPVATPRRGRYLAQGMGIGISVGMALGLVLGIVMDNMGLGIALGPALGTSLGVAIAAGLQQKNAGTDAAAVSSMTRQQRLIIIAIAILGIVILITLLVARSAVG